MSLVLIRQALETQLNTITPTLATAWENVPFTPVSGVAYQQVNLVIAGNKDITVSDSSYIMTGFLQVMLVYPIGTGAKLASTRADLLLSTFKRGLELTASGVKVRIHKAPVIAPAIIDGAFYKLPVTIYFNTFISL
jgi:hypothetical protein